MKPNLKRSAGIASRSLCFGLYGRAATKADPLCRAWNSPRGNLSGRERAEMRRSLKLTWLVGSGVDSFTTWPANVTGDSPRAACQPHANANPYAADSLRSRRIAPPRNPAGLFATPSFASSTRTRLADGVRAVVTALKLPGTGWK